MSPLGAAGESGVIRGPQKGKIRDPQGGGVMGDELSTWQEIYHCWSVYIRPYGDGYSRESTPFGRIDYLLNNFTVLWVGLLKDTLLSLEKWQ